MSVDTFWRLCTHVGTWTRGQDRECHELEIIAHFHLHFHFKFLLSHSHEPHITCFHSLSELELTHQFCASLSLCGKPVHL